MVGDLPKGGEWVRGVLDVILGACLGHTISNPTTTATAHCTITTTTTTAHRHHHHYYYDHYGHYLEDEVREEVDAAGVDGGEAEKGRGEGEQAEQG